VFTIIKESHSLFFSISLLDLIKMHLSYKHIIIYFAYIGEYDVHTEYSYFKRTRDRCGLQLAFEHYEDALFIFKSLLIAHHIHSLMVDLKKKAQKLYEFLFLVKRP
jgi:hypothetical protein